MSVSKDKKLCSFDYICIKELCIAFLQMQFAWQSD
jgi:hypothetical protein